MKRLLLMIFMSALVFSSLSGVALMAQNCAVNGHFETGELPAWWSNLDPSLKVVTTGPSGVGLTGYACFKHPGEPNNVSPMTQPVYLTAGVTYEFKANIVSKYCST